MIRFDDIQDDEIRVVGGGHALGHGRGQRTAFSRGRLAAIVAACILCLGLTAVLCVLLYRHFRPVSPEGPVPEVFDPSSSTVTPLRPYRGAVAPLSEFPDASVLSCTEHIRRTINDIPLDIYIPHNAVPKLYVGTPDIHDKKIILAAQAADIRADNGKIAGAFVLAGQPLAWGLSKKGYVGIIDGKITIGTADNSPLFEEATETGGYFFRQYPLVSDGRLVENEPKNKALRRAVCDRAGEIFIVLTAERESFHDFSQALVDLGVDEAVYLVGASSYGFWRDASDRLVQFNEKRRGGYKYENFIIWERQ